MLVSIIVPFYNIQECVNYCLDSILNQSYSSFEVLCIDDGSTDSTGALLDERSVRDPRIRVFHKNNGGLSDARNFGLLHACGDMVTFVDGDDVISPYYLEALVGCVGDDEGVLVIGQAKKLPQSEAVNGTVVWRKPQNCIELSKEEILLKYMYEEVLPGAWSRLGARELYESIPFPVGAYYEEIATAADFVGASASIKLLDEPIYGYVMREDSIVHKKSVKIKQIDDYLDALDRFGAAAKGVVERNNAAWNYMRCLHLSRMFRLAETVEDDVIGSKAVQEVAVSIARENLGSLLSDERITMGNKVRFLILAILPWKYCTCFDFYEAR